MESDLLASEKISKYQTMLEEIVQFKSSVLLETQSAIKSAMNLCSMHLKFLDHLMQKIKIKITTLSSEDLSSKQHLIMFCDVNCMNCSNLGVFNVNKSSYHKICRSCIPDINREGQACMHCKSFVKITADLDLTVPHSVNWQSIILECKHKNDQNYEILCQLCEKIRCKFFHVKVECEDKKNGKKLELLIPSCKYVKEPIYSYSAANNEKPNFPKITIFNKHDGDINKQLKAIKTFNNKCNLTIHENI